ncbi:MAG TPA: DUF3048 domain-containing protein [Clostridiales bacterium]|nr:DUF3048 domain-containing protein [Clostridiales bacterium]
MKIRICALILLISLLLFSGCQNQTDPAAGSYTPIFGESSSDPSSSEVQQEPEPQIEYALNPLTGLKDLHPDKAGNRPVAVMINNISTAWDVQTGLCAADIVYETYVEGGITRLLAVYKDISKAPQIGTVRSARYSYVDLAAGHDAVYIHAGYDPVYCAQRFKSVKITHFDLNGNSSSLGFRETNGKSREHTLYTTGSKLYNGLKKSIQTKSSATWFKFRDQNDPAVPGEGPCTKLSVPFSANYVSAFEYDPQAGMYKKFQSSTPHTDYKTGQQINVKNILVLLCSVSYFDDNYHVKTDLSSGSGYYVSQGGYQKINWKKGNASSPFKITLQDGSELVPNAGNFWICLLDKNQSRELRIS